MISKVIGLESILDVISEKSGMSVELLKSKTRRAEVVEVKYIFYYVCRKYYPFTLAHIAEFFGSHHATVLHGVRQIENYISIDRFFEERVLFFTMDLHVEAEFKSLRILLDYRKKTFDLLQSLNIKVRDLEEKMKEHGIESL